VVEASRKLDAQIAELLGCQVVYGAGLHYPNPACGCRATPSDKGQHSHPTHPTNEIAYYSLTIVGAWEVVRAAKAQGYRFTITCQGDECLRIVCEGGDCNCPIRKPYDPGDGHGFTLVDSEDWDDPQLDNMEVPLAICLAYMEAREK